MKHVLAILLLTAVALGQPAAPPAQSVPEDQANARKAKMVLDQMVQALGGSAYLNIQDIRQEGRSYSFHLGKPNSVGTVFWRFYRYPDQERLELTKKRDVIYVYRGDKGYEVTFKGTREDDPKTVTEILRRRQYALDWVVRHWLNQPGIALFYDGPTVAEQKNADQVTIMNSQNQGVTLFIDTDTHLPIKKTYSWRDPTDKQRNVEGEVYDAYRPVQGIMTPFSVTRFYNGDMSNQRFLTSVSYNQSLSDDLFNVSVTYDPNKPLPKR